MPESFVTAPPPDLAARLLPLLLDEMTAGIALFDAAGHRRLANARFDALLGTPAAAAQAGAPLAGHLAALPEAMAAQLLAAFATGARQGLDWRDAAGRHLDLTLIPAAGLGTLLLLRDSSARRAAEADLAAQRARMEHLLANTEDAVVLMDPEGVILANSIVSGDLLDLPKELVQPGATHQDIIRHLYRRGDYGFDVPEEEFVQSRRARILAAGTIHYAAPMPGGRWVEYRFRTLEDGHLLINVREITELKRRELELERERAEAAEQRDRLDTLLRHLRDFVVLFDENNQVLLNSDTGELMGLTPEQIAPGTSLTDILAIRFARGEMGPPPADPRAAAAQMVDGIRAKGGVRAVQRTVAGAFVELDFRPLPNGRLLLIGRNVTELEQARQDAEEQRAIVQTVIDNLPDAVMLYDSEFRWRMGNRRLMEFQRLTPDIAFPGAQGRDILRFQARRGDFGPPPADEAGIEALALERERVMRAPEGARYMRRSAGGYWIEYNMIPLPDGGLLGYYRDISLLKQQEQQIEEERTLLREILDACDALIVLSDKDSNVLLASNRQRDIMETPDHLYQPGTNLADAIRHRYRQGMYGFEKDEETTVRERLANPFQGGVVQYTRTSPSGRSVQHIFTPISGGRIVGFHRDITILKRQEEQIAQERALLQEVLSGLDEVVVLFDEETNVLVSNARGNPIITFPPELLEPGSSLREATRHLYRRGDFGFAKDEETVVSERLAIAYTPGGLRYTREVPGGRWLEFKYTPISGKRLLAQSRDITALKQSEQAALAAQAEAEAARDAAEAAAQAKSAFLAAMSHEIRTPMNGVLGMLEVLGRSQLQPEQGRAITVMRESAQSLLRIIDDVLDFSKIEAGRMELEAVPMRLADVLDSTIATLMPEAERRGLTLFADPPRGGPAWLLGDPTRIRQILFNLTGNALKFTERGYVRVSLEARAQGGVAAVTLAVEDSGIGLEEEVLARLFQPFTQADSSTTRRFGGSGLGLSIVRRLAELMGGEVRAHSTPGRGSRFVVTLRLPVTEAPEQPIVPRVPGAITAEGGVLVVDDHPVNREVLTRQLELLGVRASGTAADGEEALALWRLTRPATVLLDIHMPVMDGFALARAIRAEEQGQGLARTILIAVTANALKGEAERCYAAGMDGFVPKPVTLESLAEALGRAGPQRAGAGPARTALFDAAALRGLFGDDRERLVSIVESFATQARLDLSGMMEAEGQALAGMAHRLKGAARMVGARRLAEAAAEVEEEARAGAERSRLLEAMPALLEETLAAARPLLEG